MPSTQPTVLINTSYGPLTLELYPANAPITVSNFLRYVDEDFYNGTIFHRIIDNFMIQGGGLSQSLVPKTTHSPIVLESNTGLSNLQGTIAMARTSAADSATSQFYINTVNNLSLDYRSTSSPGYAVFGAVIDGMDVANAISDARVATVQINGQIYQNFPYPNPIAIFSIDRYEQSAQLLSTTHIAGTNEYGVTLARYEGNRSDFGVKLNADKTLSVTRVDGQHASEILNNTQRLEFTNHKFAYDTAGKAGDALEFIGALAYDQVGTTAVFSTILDYFDQGHTLTSLSQYAIDVGLVSQLAGSSSNEDLARLIYRNIVGQEADTAMTDSLVGYLDGRSAKYTQAEFIAVVAELELNQQHINLVGFQATGIEYI